MDLSAQGERARKLKRLTEHEGWAELGKVYAELRTRYTEQTVSRLLRKNHEFNQRDIDYNAGYFAGMKALLDNPDKVGDTLERVLRRNESR